MDNFTIYGVKGSAAETYATENGFEFREIGSDDHDPNTCTLHVCAECGRSCELHVCVICERICTDPECQICNGNPDRVPCDKGCCDPDNEYVAIRGHILANEEIAIFDALEILKALVGMDSVISKCDNAKTAALITGDSAEPTIFDALEILKHLVNMPSKVQQYLMIKKGGYLHKSNRLSAIVIARTNYKISVRILTYPANCVSITVKEKVPHMKRSTQP